MISKFVLASEVTARWSSCSRHHCVFTY
jgi:hypothetical protein